MLIILCLWEKGQHVEVGEIMNGLDVMDQMLLFGLFGFVGTNWCMAKWGDI